MFIKLIMDMRDGVVTSVRTSRGITSEFSIAIGLHQVSTLSPYLFALVMDELTKSIQEEVLWCIYFFLQMIQFKWMKLDVQLMSRQKFGLECKFSKSRNKDEMAAKLDGQEILLSFDILNQ